MESYNKLVKIDIIPHPHRRSPGTLATDAEYFHGRRTGSLSRSGR